MIDNAESVVRVDALVLATQHRLAVLAQKGLTQVNALIM